MKQSYSLDMTEFNAAWKQFQEVMKKTLEKATNDTMFFVLLRAFLSLGPKDPQAKRNQVRAYLNAPDSADQRFDKRTGKAVGRDRIFRRVHRIVMAKMRDSGKPSFWKGKTRQIGNDAMKEAAKQFRLRAVGSVGYLKGSIVKAIRKLQGHFAQFGRATSTGRNGTVKRGYVGNPAAIRLAAEYNHATGSNVSIHKGTYAFVYPATVGFNPNCKVDIALHIKPDQAMQVDYRMTDAFNRAYHDEAIDKMKFVARQLQADANEFNVKKFPLPT